MERIRETILIISGNFMCLDQSIQKVSLMNSSHLEPVVLATAIRSL